jgi:hypothetical protein
MRICNSLLPLGKNSYGLERIQKRKLVAKKRPSAVLTKEDYRFNTLRRLLKDLGNSISNS